MQINHLYLLTNKHCPKDAQNTCLFCCLRHEKVLTTYLLMLITRTLTPN